MEAARETMLADPFVAVEHAPGEMFASLVQRRAGQIGGEGLPAGPGCEVATLHGFDLEDQPLLTGIQELRGEVVSARTAVALRTEMVGASVVIVFENGDRRRPIVLGALAASCHTPPAVTALADDERVVISAQREVVLQCGAASITLTRSGKVLIQGNYVLSRSSGYNKIKGAAVDIN